MLSDKSHRYNVSLNSRIVVVIEEIEKEEKEKYHEYEGVKFDV